MATAQVGHVLSVRLLFDFEPELDLPALDCDLPLEFLSFRACLLSSATLGFSSISIVSTRLDTLVLDIVSHSGDLMHVRFFYLTAVGVGVEVLEL